MKRLMRVQADGDHEALNPSLADAKSRLEPRTARPMLLRIPEVAAELRLGRSSGYQLIKAGELPVVRIGRAVRVSRADLEAWVDDQRQAQRR